MGLPDKEQRRNFSLLAILILIVYVRLDEFKLDIALA